MNDVFSIPAALERAIRERLAAFEHAVALRKDGRISDEELRPLRLALCLHQEADPRRYMLRVRIPCGEARAEHLETVAVLARASGEVRSVHLTTRQCFQVHGLRLEDGPGAIRFLLDRGLATAGTCGNAVRNVGACERAGLCLEEVLDARMVARKLSDALAVYPGHALPRKFKIGVSGCARDCAATVLQDAGWVARQSADGPTFDLWGGGGLGARPREAVPLAEGVPLDRVVDVTRALIDIFDCEGDRKNRKRARLKFVVQRLGNDEMRARLHAIVGPLGAPSTLGSGGPAKGVALSPCANADRWSRMNVTAERRTGLYSCAVTVPEGDVSPGQLEAVAKLARSHGDGTVRLSAEQNLLVPGVLPDRLAAVHAALCSYGLGLAGAGWAGDPVSCPGQDVCGLAFTRSRDASRAIRERLTREPALVEGLGRCALRVSGCPNGCARHATAALGLQGMLRGTKAFYRIWRGPWEERPRLARPVPGAVAENDLPERVIEELGIRAASIRCCSGGEPASLRRGVAVTSVSSVSGGHAVTQKYRLVTRSDFDGLVCAVLLKELGILDDIKFVHPKDMQDGKVEVTGRDITTNIPYVPGVHLAFDHHLSEMVRIKDRPGNQIIDPEAPSASRVVYKYFGGGNSFPRVSEEMMTAVDKADSARFSMDEILNPTDWVLLNCVMDPRTGLGRFRDFRISNYQLMMDLIGACQTLSIGEILKLPDMKERVDLYVDHQARAQEQIRRCSKVHKNLVVLDLRGEEIINPTNRFTIYALFPQCNISMHVMWGLKKQNTVFAIGKSILDRSSRTNIGNLTLEFGGGGHQAAGTCQIDNDKAESVLGQLISRITADG